MKKSKTERGFDLYEGVDRYNQKYSLQKSSIAFEDCIWLGVNDPDPRMLDREVGIGRGGWISCSLPEGVVVTTKVHLTQEHAKELIPILQRFVDTGEI